MTPRDFGPPNRAPRELFATLASERRSGSPSSSAPSASALPTKTSTRCHACLTIPTDPAYGSLNLAQAVQLIAYDWRQALGGFRRAANGRSTGASPTPSRCGAWSATGRRRSRRSASSTRRRRKKLMARLQRLANRAGLSEDEVHILRGIARAIDERCR